MENQFETFLIKLNKNCIIYYLSLLFEQIVSQLFLLTKSTFKRNLFNVLQAYYFIILV